jgi:hypothetical protein
VDYGLFNLSSRRKAMYGKIPGKNYPSPKQIDLYGYNEQLNTNIEKRNGIIFVEVMRLGHNLASTK